MWETHCRSATHCVLKCSFECFVETQYKYLYIFFELKNLQSNWCTSVLWVFCKFIFTNVCFFFFIKAISSRRPRCSFWSIDDLWHTMILDDIHLSKPHIPQAIKTGVSCTLEKPFARAVSSTGHNSRCDPIPCSNKNNVDRRMVSISNQLLVRIEHNN